ncbi:MAG: Lrp/AsnC family transcriptional regulator, partial [Candidatus Hermodarchaeota archaeon]|nr:Lrp/AsnC family transcriptional regulator [Candidatus Hermodarchaeota archaeon]
IITGYSVVIDPMKLELPIFITVGVECEPALTKRVAEAIARFPNFYLVWIVTGAHNIHAKGMFSSAEEMQRIVGDLMSKTEGITSYHLSLRFEAVKEPYLVPQDLFTTIKNQRAKS